MGDLVQRAKVMIKIGHPAEGNEREVSVDADVLGAFAVHKGPQLAGWTVTHMPTGRSVCNFLDRAESGLVLARNLHALGGWDFTEAEAVKSWPASRMVTVRQAIRWVRRDDQLGRYVPPKYASDTRKALGAGE